MRPPEDALRTKIRVLNDALWERRVGGVLLEDWLNNFSGVVAPAQEERLHALFILSNFTYFGSREIRELLKALFRDHFEHRVIADLRKKNGSTRDHRQLRALFEQELETTRFLGLGKASESGSYLTYPFRQVNGLGTRHFGDVDKLIIRSRHRSLLRRILERVAPSKFMKTRRAVTRYVFLDDFIGSGNQASGEAGPLVRLLKKLNPQLEIGYLVLAATKSGRESVMAKVPFDWIATALEFDATDSCFSPDSRIFDDPGLPGIDKKVAFKIASSYGKRMFAGNPLGYPPGGLVVGFQHNTPDNTLPIIWYEGPSIPWAPVFKRHHKYT